jgi:hypothetical protein
VVKFGKDPIYTTGGESLVLYLYFYIFKIISEQDWEGIKMSNSDAVYDKF